MLLNFAGISGTNELWRNTRAGWSFDLAERDTLSRLDVRKLPLPTLNATARHYVCSHIGAGNVAHHRRKGTAIGWNVNPNAFAIDRDFESVHVRET